MDAANADTAVRAIIPTGEGKIFRRRQCRRDGRSAGYARLPAIEQRHAYVDGIQRILAHSRARLEGTRSSPPSTDWRCGLRPRDDASDLWVASGTASSAEEFRPDRLLVPGETAARGSCSAP